MTAKQQQAFLDALTAGDTVTGAATAAGMNRSTFQRHRKTDEDFSAAWDDALEQGTDLLEKEAQRRAYEGVDEPVWHQGVMVGTVRRYSDTLLIFLLKARRPEKFRDNAKVEHVGAGGGAIEVKLAFDPS